MSIEFLRHDIDEDSIDEVTGALRSNSLLHCYGKRFGFARGAFLVSDAIEESPASLLAAGRSA